MRARVRPYAPVISIIAELRVQGPIVGCSLGWYGPTVDCCKLDNLQLVRKGYACLCLRVDLRHYGITDVVWRCVAKGQ